MVWGIKDEYFEKVYAMPLLNYTTSISPEKTVSEIQSKLAKAGAFQILHEYDRGTSTLVGLSFRIETEFGNIAFQLPARIEAVEAILRKQRVRVKPSREQATRVAWRILKDWVEAQLALIETGMVTIEQVFLPYAQDEKGRTFYEAIRERKFAGLLTEGSQ